MVVILVTKQGGIYDSVRMIGVLGTTIILLWIFGATLKYIIRKERPSGSLVNMVMRDRYTFPSMHALTLSSASYYVFTHNVTLGVVMIGVTLLVLIARVQTRMHYISDMIAGCFIGITFTYFITPYIEKYISIFL